MFPLVFPVNADIIPFCLTLVLISDFDILIPVSVLSSHLRMIYITDAACAAYIMK